MTLDNDHGSASRSNIVGDEGQVYLTGCRKRPAVSALGEKSSEQCTVHYDFSGMALGDDILFYQAECR
ncbi:FimD/PapC C-terminal domain-containing protein [Klebsiella pneumoniae]